LTGAIEADHFVIQFARETHSKCSFSELQERGRKRGWDREGIAFQSLSLTIIFSFLSPFTYLHWTRKSQRRCFCSLVIIDVGT
jgi:hypothetical protein